MEKYTIDTDFSTLKDSQTYEWMLEFSDMVEEAFVQKDSRCCLFGNLFFMELYVYIIRKGLQLRNQELSAVLQKALDVLWGYWDGHTDLAVFEEFANNLFACILAYCVGEDLTDAQMEFDQKYFVDKSFTFYEEKAIGWCSDLLIQLVAIEGGQFYQEDLQKDMEGYDRIDFRGLKTMLNLLKIVCMDCMNISRLSNNVDDIIKAEKQVYQTVLFQQIVKRFQDNLKVVLNATPEQFMDLRNEYQKYSIVPAEYLQQFLKYFVSI